MSLRSTSMSTPRGCVTDDLDKYDDLIMVLDIIQPYPMEDGLRHARGPVL